jgi:hypothetical protein
MALAAVAHMILPDTVAIHFGAGGTADSWAPKIVHTLLFAGLYTLIYLLFAVLPRLSFRLPKEFINIPHRDFWLLEENRKEALRRMEAGMAEFGIATFALLGGGAFLTLRANLREPVVLENGWFFAALALYLVYTLLWCARLYRTFRVPSTTRP